MRQIVERQIQLQHIHPRLAQKTKVRPSVCCAISAAHAGLGQPTRLGHARRLVSRRCPA